MVAKDVAKEPWTREIGPELQQICHLLPGRHGIQADVIGIANMYAFPGQVRIRSQDFSDPYVGGQPFWEYGDSIPVLHNGDKFFPIPEWTMMYAA